MANIGRFMLFCLRAGLLVLTLRMYWEVVGILMEVRNRLQGKTSFSLLDEEDEEGGPLPWWDWTSRSKAREKRADLKIELEELEKQIRQDRAAQAWAKASGGGEA